MAKRPRFNSVDLDCMSAFAHGYAHGVQGLKLHSLWGENEEGYQYQIKGWHQGIDYLINCGELSEDAEPINFDEYFGD